MFQLPAEMEDNPAGVWFQQRVSNVQHMIQLVRALVAPGSPAQVNDIPKIPTTSPSQYSTFKLCNVKIVDS